MANIQDTSSGRMSQARFQAAEDRTSARSSKLSPASSRTKTQSRLFLDLRRVNGHLPEASWEMITLSPGESSTLNFGECPREDAGSSLSLILQAGVPSKYYLSPKACEGILRRASARGKELPEVLKLALTRQASMDTTGA